MPPPATWRRPVAVLIALFALSLAPPALAAWQTRVLMDGAVVSQTREGRIAVQLSCLAGVGRRLQLTVAARGFPRAIAEDSMVTLAIALPNGQTVHQPARATIDPSGRALTGWIAATPAFLDALARGSRLGLEHRGKTLLATAMTGTARAREAMREHCGF
ncbi:MAG: hypothetical protein AAF371_02465 [Pseudomonadota bacterium]